jgi:dTDP-4-dehydrorhamnose reductase
MDCPKIRNSIKQSSFGLYLCNNHRIRFSAYCLLNICLDFGAQTLFPIQKKKTQYNLGAVNKLLITGANGLLGQKIVKRCLKHNIPFLASSLGSNRNTSCPDEFYQTLDICSKEEIGTLFTNNSFHSVIHTAALTNVDYCELHPNECQEVNVNATKKLFEFAYKNNIHFQLLSTDFVFDGEKGNYSEIDSVNPLSIYAESKVNAENILIQSEYENWSIARTIIVYGTAHALSRSNLVLWAIEALPENEPMRLVNDQFRAPTWADDLAYGCVEIIKRNKKGIYHLAGPKVRSVEEIVREVAIELQINSPLIEIISSTTLSQPAKRPPRTGFNLEKAIRELDYDPKDIREAVQELIKELG